MKWVNFNRLLKLFNFKINKVIELNNFIELNIDIEYWFQY